MPRALPVPLLHTGWPTKVLLRLHVERHLWLLCSGPQLRRPATTTTSASIVTSCRISCGRGVSYRGPRDLITRGPGVRSRATAGIPCRIMGSPTLSAASLACTILWRSSTVQVAQELLVAPHLPTTSPSAAPSPSWDGHLGATDAATAKVLVAMTPVVRTVTEAARPPATVSKACLLQPSCRPLHTDLQPRPLSQDVLHGGAIQTTSGAPFSAG